MKPVAFAYERPRSVAQALSLLQDDPPAKLIAGGQSLIPMMNFRLSRPQRLIDLNGLEELSFIDRVDGALRIGALVRHQRLHEDTLVRAHLPVLAEAAGEVGHWAIRSRGTLGGSLAHADPASELPAAMVALDARFDLQSSAGTRQVAARDFFLGMLTTDLQDGEILTAVQISLRSGVSYGFAELARRPGDFALAGAFVQRADRTGAVTWFGVSSSPERRELEFASDADLRRRQWQALADELDPLEQPEYRRRLAVQVAEAAYDRTMEGSR